NATQLTVSKKVLQSKSQVLKSLTLLHSDLVHIFPYARGEYSPNTTIVSERRTTAPTLLKTVVPLLLLPRPAAAAPAPVAALPALTRLPLPPAANDLAVKKSNSWAKAMTAKYS